jgi:hypothetical protein
MRSIGRYLVGNYDYGRSIAKNHRLIRCNCTINLTGNLALFALWPTSQHNEQLGIRLFEFIIQRWESFIISANDFFRFFPWMRCSIFRSYPSASPTVISSLTSVSPLVSLAFWVSNCIPIEERQHVEKRPFCSSVTYIRV